MKYEHHKWKFGPDPSLSMGISSETQNLTRLINFNMFLQPERKGLLMTKLLMPIFVKAIESYWNYVVLQVSILQEWLVKPTIQFSKLVKPSQKDENLPWKNGPFPSGDVWTSVENIWPWPILVQGNIWNSKLERVNKLQYVSTTWKKMFSSRGFLDLMTKLFMLISAEALSWDVWFCLN